MIRTYKVCLHVDYNNKITGFFFELERWLGGCNYRSYRGLRFVKSKVGLQTGNATYNVLNGGLDSVHTELLPRKHIDYYQVNRKLSQHFWRLLCSGFLFVRKAVLVNSPFPNSVLPVPLKLARIFPIFAILWPWETAWQFYPPVNIPFLHI